MTRAIIDRFRFERALFRQGLRLVAGVDEAGRGPLAGPVVAGAVMLPRQWTTDGLPPQLEGLNDSKQLTAMQRETFFAALVEHPDVHHACAMVDAATVDSINILQATHRAMNQALKQLPLRPQHVLMDGLRVKSLRHPQTALVQGDARSYSIAAASVVAKVTRDRLMVKFDELYPAYGFAAHKGYGTPQHLTALAAWGPCPIHRRSFSPLKVDGQPELRFDSPP